MNGINCHVMASVHESGDLRFFVTFDQVDKDTINF
jgi:hypothetical protein